MNVEANFRSFDDDKFKGHLLVTISFYVSFESRRYAFLTGWSSSKVLYTFDDYCIITGRVLELASSANRLVGHSLRMFQT